MEKRAHGNISQASDIEESKRFICPYEGCGKSFAAKGNLSTHIRIHVGYYIYTSCLDWRKTL